MTGTISTLNTQDGSGSIKADNGLSVHFDSSAVLAYDAACLEVGLLVTFELMSGHDRRAVNVCVQKQITAAQVGEKRSGNTSLRYLGFEQTDSIRAYRFERISPGGTTKGYLVTTDLALFAKHHVGIQEGPWLCLRLLAEELAAAEQTGRPPRQRLLTDQDMAAYAASRPAPGTTSGRRRVRQGSGAPAHPH